MLEVAPDLGIWFGLLWIIIVRRIWIGLLFLFVLTCKLVAILEDPNTFAERLIVSELARVECAIWKYPLPTDKFALQPVSNKFRSIFCIAVSSFPMFLSLHPLSYINVSIRICERSLGLAFVLRILAPSHTSIKVAKVGAFSHRGLVVIGWRFVSSALRSV